MDLYLYLLLLTSLHGLSERQPGRLLKLVIVQLQLGPDQHNEQVNCGSVCCSSVNASIPLLHALNDTADRECERQGHYRTSVVTVQVKL